MKTVIMRIQKSSRLTVMLVAAVVAIVTCTVVAQTEEALLTPNKTVLNYSLAPGGNSGGITPVPNVPVLVMGCCTTLGVRGVGHVSLLRIPNSFVEWVGLESPFNGSITNGYSGTPGTHIVFIDYSAQVDIEVAGPNSIRVHNGAASGRTGNVTLIW
jgi:hypothetical protein